MMDQDPAVFRDGYDVMPVATDFLGVRGLKTFFLICPPHMLKNMMNSLYASQDGRAKCFLFDGVKMTFQHVLAAYYRELNRADAGLVRRVPRMTQDVVFKNPWNVMSIPNNKVLVHGELSAEMTAHMEESQDYTATKTVEYIQVMETTFRDVFLNKELRVSGMDSIVFDKLEEADSFIRRWQNDVDRVVGRLGLSAEEKSRVFLAWQTFDLWRVMIRGFQGYCRDFFQRYGDIHDVFLKPSRMTGSALELIFCCLKQLKGANGAISEAQLEDAISSLMVQKMTGALAGNQYYDKDLDAELDATVFLRRS
jgi:hypothetical protein